MVFSTSSDVERKYKDVDRHGGPLQIDKYIYV